MTQPAGRAFPARTVAVMILLGYLPLLHAASVVALCVLPLIGKMPLWTLALAPGVLYLMPPLAVRLAVLVHPLPTGSCEIGSAGFLVWWLTAQWQILFTRLPALEELLRLVPGLYSLWLRLWGARIGRLVYWSPGVLVFDRPLVQIGDRVILGSGLRIVPHFIGPDEAGRRSLVIAPVKIGSDAIVGGHAVISPGVEIAPGAVTIATRSVRPFAVVKSLESAEELNDSTTARRANPGQATQGLPTATQAALRVPEKFNRNSSTVSSLMPPEESGQWLLQRMQRQLGIADYSTQSLLDFGCGVRFSQAILNLGLPIGRYVGVDCFQEMIEFLTTSVRDPRFAYHLLDIRHPLYNPSGTVLLGPETQLPLPQQQFDIVSMFSVLTHQYPDDAMHILTMLRRYVRPHGHLFFTCFLDETIHSFEDRSPDQNAERCHYNPAFLEDLVARSGWQPTARYAAEPPLIGDSFVCRLVAPPGA